MEYTARHCRACYARLAATEPAWKVLCRECFIESKKREQSDLREEVELLRFEVARLRADRAAPIDKTMIRTLLQLCHPDKHGDSPAATKATQYLLSLREKVTSEANA